MIEWRNLSADRMIATAKRARFFQRKNVSRLFCDAEHLTRARWIGADFAHFARSKESAQTAGMNRLTRVRDGTRDLLRLIAARSHHPKRNPLRGTRTDARHLPQLCN